MKISAVKLIRSTEQGRPGHLLVLRSDSGLSATGEIASLVDGDFTDRSAGRLRDMLVGRDPFDVEALLTEARNVTDGTVADMALVSAAAATMLDLAGHSLGVRMNQLLGGRMRDRVRACAIGWASGASGKRQLSATARRTVAAGYTMLRVEAFASSTTTPVPDVLAATEVVKAVRAAVPDEVDLVVAADPRLSVPAAIEFADAIRFVEPVWLEDPVGTSPVEPLRRVSEAVNVPLAGGRGARPDVLSNLATGNVVDHIIVEVGRVGGPSAARRLAALAEVHHIGVVPTGSGGSVSLASALQVAAVLPNVSTVEVPLGLAAVKDGMVAT
jgi:galactonate dehydratase